MRDLELLAEIVRTYEGSDGDRTKALFARLEPLGPAGTIAINLFRAEKNSSRAKRYRGGVPGRGSYRGMAYDRKQWAMDQLAAALLIHAAALGLVWGWQEDREQVYHRQVLYVDLPTGQMSFHTAERGAGPDYPGAWDGIPGASQAHLIDWLYDLLAGAPG